MSNKPNLALASSYEAVCGTIASTCLRLTTLDPDSDEYDKAYLHLYRLEKQKEMLQSMMTPVTWAAALSLV